MPPRKSKAGSAVELVRIEDTTIVVPVIGLTDVIPHQWSQKALRLMREKQFGMVAQKREAKNPEEEAEAAMYRLEDGRAGMPGTAFKAAMVAACRFFEGLPMTEGRLMVYVQGHGPQQLVPLAGAEMMREDTPRNATGVVDLRYRTAVLAPWTAELTITFPPRLISESSILALADASGRVGVGDWRPGSPKSNSGTYGTYRIDESRELGRA